MKTTLAIIVFACLASTIHATTMNDSIETTNTILNDTLVEIDSAIDSVPTSFRDSIMSFAEQFLGRGYRSYEAGITLDCSGYMLMVFKHFDIRLPRTATEQYHFGTKLKKKNLEVGDLVFYKTVGHKRIGHVGMIVGLNDDGSFKFIHSSTHGGIKIDNSTQNYYAARYIGAARVIQNKR